MSITSPTSPPTSETDISVMLVDDSAVIRRVLRRIVDAIPSASVISTFGDGAAASSAAARVKPDIVILDIEMPIMDGLTALPKILEGSPKTKVIMFSSLTEKGASVTMEAMRLGAVECIVKPSASEDVGEGSPFQTHIADLIVGLVPHKKPKAATLAAPVATPAQKDKASGVKPPVNISGPYTLRNNDPAQYKGKPAIVAIGSSTGGPSALFNVLKHCTGFDVPIVITQHMPATFTKILAQHIQQHTGLEAQEGAEGMVVEAGKVYVAPGGFHMLFVLKGGQLTITLDDGPMVNFCKPAVDPMFNNLATIYGQKVLGVILTGMGHDGLRGGETLVNNNARLIAQDEKTSVVWGMPGAVAQAGLCSNVMPLNEIGSWIKRAVIG